ncbi:RagB/SusD family nutrient uptake outer membrane protein [Pedobacter africanus]|uniref:SusD family protein n=1 Tax=Pedobacter africanus TaxID=151894 RepID=A0A1W1ZBD4_9SPHI|nr:RagB/SusD family nutrient uptake outer membrane protein [Pedobacter africanus]SMC45511.1 SusD family protein [Pedobacter africanus]
MKNFKYILIQLVFSSLVLTGCDKYLDITPKGKTLLTTVTHYDQWLNDNAFFEGAGTISYLNDNVDVVSITTPPTIREEFVYTWGEQYSVNVSEAPLFWGDHYAKINLYNTVLVGIDKATGGTTAQKKSLKAEALLGRALEYFYLMNEYCQPYDAATAVQNPGVPFVTSNDVTEKVPSRGTLAELYQHILDDINAAIPDLPLDNSINRFRGSVAAGYSVLARVYFYSRNYAAAKINAELALANTKAVMINYNGTLPLTNLISTHSEVIYGRYVVGNITASLDFMRSFASNDRRVRMLYRSSDGYAFTTRGATLFIPTLITPVLGNVNTGTSVQEMKLIAAEAAARSNDLTTALRYLDEIRVNRFATASYVKYTSAVQEDVLKEVLSERSHELPYNGLRWFDMRRLDQDNRMGTVTRYNAQGGVVATLPPHSNKYTLQIPYQVMSFNPGMQQNPY